MIVSGTGGWDRFHCLCYVDCMMTDIKGGWVVCSCMEGWDITVNCVGGGNLFIVVEKTSL